MPNKNYKLLFLIFFAIAIAKESLCEEKKYLHGCGIYEIDNKPSDIQGIPVIEDGQSFRRLVDPKGFKDFVIHFYKENIEYEIKENNLTKNYDLIMNAIDKAINTLEKLLKVKPFKDNYALVDQIFNSCDIKYWEKDKYGSEAYYNHSKTLLHTGYDLIIFGKIYKTDPSILAGARPILLENSNGRP